MKNIFYQALHKLFFLGLKVPPKSSWKAGLSALGTIEEFAIFRSSKKIAAVLVSPQHLQPLGTVILAHPLSRKAKYFFSDDLRIKNYLKLGYRTLLFDFNGFGESDLIDPFFWKDTEKVIEFVCEHLQQEALILHGLSFGSFHAIRAIPALPKGSKVILENTNRSLYDYWKCWPHTALAIKILELKFISPGFVRDMNVINVFKQLDRSDIRFLFITCSDDKFTPRVEMEELAAYLKSEKNFLHTKDTKHLEAPKDTNYDFVLTEFLQK